MFWNTLCLSVSGLGLFPFLPSCMQLMKVALLMTGLAGSVFNLLFAMFHHDSVALLCVQQDAAFLYYAINHHVFDIIYSNFKLKWLSLRLIYLQSSFRHAEVLHNRCQEQHF